MISIQLASCQSVFKTNKSSKRGKAKTINTTSKTLSKISPSYNYMRGIASFYGYRDGFDGKKMANGKPFRANNIHLAAHPTLPLGTKLKVTRVDNNRYVYVEVTDRMPRRKRVIDLSVAAAKHLDMFVQGLAEVKLEKISDSEYNKHL